MAVVMHRLVILICWFTLINSHEREITKPFSIERLHVVPRNGHVVLVGDDVVIDVVSDIATTLWPPVVVKVVVQDRRVLSVKRAEVPVFWNHSKQHGINDSEGHFSIRALRPGRSFFQFDVLERENRSLLGVVESDYEVTVVEQVNILRDAFIYVLLTTQMLTLLMIAFRMRVVAIKEVLRRPCSLISAVVCQAVLMPLVAIAVCVALSLPVHAVVCILILGCCPTALLSPLMAVFHQSHVELAVILSLLTTTTAFGVMPLWLFTYGNFLGLTYDKVSTPYFFIAGALMILVAPLVVGVLTQRCSPRLLPRMDRAIPPTCALMLLMEFVVTSVNFHHTWRVLTWQVTLAATLLPLCGCVIGMVLTLAFRQKLPQVKTVSIVTAVQNTVLAKVIVQLSYPAADASLMMVTLSCVDFITMCIVFVAYLPHAILWFWWTPYRPLHTHNGIGGLDLSIGEQLVRSMTKAGEITFGKLQNSPGSLGNNLRAALDYPAMKPFKSSLTVNTLNSLHTLGSKQQDYSSSDESIYKTGSSQLLHDSLFPAHYMLTPKGSSTSSNNECDSIADLEFDIIISDKRLPDGPATPMPPKKSKSIKKKKDKATRKQSLESLGEHSERSPPPTYWELEGIEGLTPISDGDSGRHSDSPLPAGGVSLSEQLDTAGDLSSIAEETCSSSTSTLASHSDTGVADNVGLLSKF